VNEPRLPADEPLPAGLPAEVFFWVPVARNPNGRMVLSFERARAAAAEAKVASFRIAYWDHLSVDIASKRELGADRFLREATDCEWLMMVDDDMDFRIDPLAIAKLVLAAKKADAQIVAPLMVRRDAPHWVAYNEVRGVPDNTLKAVNWLKKNEIVEMKGHVGTGVILIHRSVFAKVPRPWFYTEMTRRCQGDGKPDGFKCRISSEDAAADPNCPVCKGSGQNPNGTWVAVGEDAYFCRKAIDHGFKCVLAAGVVVGHIGETPFTIQESIRDQFPAIHANAMLQREAALNAAEKADSHGIVVPGLGPNGNGNGRKPPAEIVIAR
jgi:hypothetical protein